MLGEILLLLRGIPEKNAKCHRGVWEKLANRSVEARGKLGIIGYGHIGTQLGIIAESIGMKVYYYDIENKLSLGNAIQVPSMVELLNMSDVISLHVPETASTKDLIGAEQLRMMKPGAIFINASRGTVVDIDALADVIKSGHISGAAIDVFPSEPKSNDEEFLTPLRGLDNVILTLTSAAPPRKPRRTSGWKWPTSWSNTPTTAPPSPPSTSPRSPCPATRAPAACCTFTATSPA